MAQSYQDVVLGFVTSSPVDAISHKRGPERVPNVFYKTPAQHNHFVDSRDGSAHTSAFSPAAVMQTFGACPEGIICTINLSSLGGRIENLARICTKSRQNATNCLE